MEWKIKLIKESARIPDEPYHFEDGYYFAKMIYHFEHQIIGKEFKDDKYIKNNVVIQNVQARKIKDISYYRKWAKKMAKHHIKNYAIERKDEIIGAEYYEEYP